ncbi:MAG: FmdB family zinc ribbon protein [Planctomycetota bacterium]
MRDDRGRGVSMLDPVTLHMLRRYDMIDREALDAISRQIGPGTSRRRRWWFWIFFVLSVAGLVGTLARVIVVGWSPDLTAQVLWILIAICLPLGVFLLWRSARQGRLRRVRGAILDHRCCPHCGYDLRDLPTDADDGATICPECGCAWMLSRAENTGHA